MLKVLDDDVVSRSADGGRWVFAPRAFSSATFIAVVTVTGPRDGLTDSFIYSSQIHRFTLLAPHPAARIPLLTALGPYDLTGPPAP